MFEYIDIIKLKHTVRMTITSMLIGSALFFDFIFSVMLMILFQSKLMSAIKSYLRSIENAKASKVEIELNTLTKDKMDRTHSIVSENVNIASEYETETHMDDGIKHDIIDVPASKEQNEK